MNLNFKHFVFDLDNTLYSASSTFFDLQLSNMSDFIVEKLKVTRKEAEFLREEYYHSFGTTMHGLMHHHGVDPYEFLAVVDNVPLERLQLNDELLGLLSELKLKGKHLSIFTNGSLYHANRVMSKLTLDKIIHDVVTLECTGLVPKPNPEAYQYCFDRLSIDPRQAVFFEDSSHNLIPAKQMGMTTVLVNADDTAHARFIAHPEIDYFVEDVSSFLKGEFLEKRA
ncbi:pyrimidine 5'-nucleotidase [Caedibacter taeniospiralis]|uniref:pyrimidine 5'-nucleotidase n=1 Tax=Caedibacter taeniospiralis TaxID=28907 RepID=UPI000C2710AC|nr:pyrimidine 5'-nucleotidase [Caedibacter taeniospiralis]